MKHPAEMTAMELLDNFQELSIAHAKLAQARNKPIPGVSQEELEEAASTYQVAINVIRAELLRKLQQKESSPMRTKEIPIEIEIINTHHLKNKKVGEYIGRGSPLGNPYSHLEGTTALYKVATREEAIEQYRIWLQKQIEQPNFKVIEELDRLAYKAISEGSLKLRCYCAPAPCHGDVIKEFLEKAIERFYREELRG